MRNCHCRCRWQLPYSKKQTTATQFLSVLTLQRHSSCQSSHFSDTVPVVSTILQRLRSCQLILYDCDTTLFAFGTPVSLSQESEKTHLQRLCSCQTTILQRKRCSCSSTILPTQFLSDTRNNPRLVRNTTVNVWCFHIKINKSK